MVVLQLEYFARLQAERMMAARLLSLIQGVQNTVSDVVKVSLAFINRFYYLKWIFTFKCAVLFLFQSEVLKNILSDFSMHSLQDLAVQQLQLLSSDILDAIDETESWQNLEPTMIKIITKFWLCTDDDIFTIKLLEVSTI